MCLVSALPSSSPYESHDQPAGKEPGNILWTQALLYPVSKASQAIGGRAALRCRYHRLLDLLLVAEHRRQKRTQKALFPRRGEWEIQCDSDSIRIRALMSGVGPARSGLGSLWAQRVAHSPQSVEQVGLARTVGTDNDIQVRVQPLPGKRVEGEEVVNVNRVNLHRISLLSVGGKR